MAEEITAEITPERVKTDQPTWKPGVKKVEVVMKPTEGEEPFFPLYGPYADLPRLMAPPKKSVVLNIETTGINPLDSRLISIAAADPRTPDDIRIFDNANEEELLKSFLAWFSATGYTEIIGYNVSFDYRFIFTHCMRYRLTAGSFYNADMFDLMNAMKQIKLAFVFGYNKPGTLDAWAEYLFNMAPSPPYEDTLRAYQAGDVQFVNNVNIDKVNKTMLLWTLLLYCEELIYA